MIIAGKQYSVDLGHVAALAAIIIPAVVAALSGQFPTGSKGALVVTVLGAVGLALKQSIAKPVQQ